MPNCCFTHYVIKGNKKEIADLMLKLESLEKRETSLVENDCGKNWLGNVIALFGGDWNEMACRGGFMNMEKPDDTTLRFDTETAWVDMPGVWDFVCEQYRSLRYYFMAEESGVCYYATNDREGKYFSKPFWVEQDKTKMA
jgi:hypothetical protein